MNTIDIPDILFDPISHTYTRNGKKYTSCTTVTGQYKRPFNRRYWAMYSTLKEKFGFTVRHDEPYNIIYINGQPYSVDSLYEQDMYREACKMLKNGWDDITKTACSRGNKIHDYLEDSINDSKDDKGGKSNSSIKPITGEFKVYNTKHDLDRTNLIEIYPEIYEVLLYYINLGATVYAEKKVYIDEFEVSGMIDCLIVFGNKFIIIDWKTNKDIIHFKSGYYKKIKTNGIWTKTQTYVEKPSYLLSPLTHREDCKGSIYTLQVSLYAYMLESWGYECKGLMIYHIRPGERPKRIPVQYWKEDIINMLNHFKFNNAV